MKTDDLVSLLAAAAKPVPYRVAVRRMGLALGLGFVGAMAVMVLDLGFDPDLAEATHMAMFWVKLAVPGSLCVAAFFVAERLSRPGGRVGAWRIGLAAPVLALWLYGAWVMVQAAPAQRKALVLGDSWRSCAFSIALISVPLLVALFWAVRGLAPTRLALAGASAGLLAGAAATLVYALHCPEMEAPFVSVWYVAGMVIPALAGAMLGPWVLRW